ARSTRAVRTPGTAAGASGPSCWRPAARTGPPAGSTTGRRPMPEAAALETRPAALAEAPLLEVEGLARHFDVSQPLLARLLSGQGRLILKAVDGVTFAIRRGETFSLVGESGCGK